MTEPTTDVYTYEYSVGRSRSGDQLHISTVVFVNSKLRTYSNNAHCNNRMRIAALGDSRRGIKAKVTFRENLFCKKCFGPRPQDRTFINCEVVEG